MRMLGIDYGTKRVGIAIGDSEVRVAVPFIVLEVSSQKSVVSGAVKEIARMVKEESVDLVVIGQGGRGRMEKKVQAFAEKLRKFVRVEIVDEHFTTAQVERAMKGYGKARKGVDIDSAAAALILQEYFDRV